VVRRPSAAERLQGASQGAPGTSQEHPAQFLITMLAGVQEPGDQPSKRTTGASFTISGRVPTVIAMQQESSICVIHALLQQI
jgi:hypothetical protein